MLYLVGEIRYWKKHWGVVISGDESSGMKAAVVGFVSGSTIYV